MVNDKQMVITAILNDNITKPLNRMLSGVTKSVDKVSDEVLKTTIDIKQGVAKEVTSIAKSVSTNLKTMKKEFISWTNSTKAKILALGVIWKSVAFVKELVELGIEGNRINNIFSRTFGDMATEVYQLGVEFQKTYGITTRFFQESTSRLFLVAQNLGFARDQAKDFSVELVGAAANLSAAWGGDLNTNINKLIGGINGMIKPLRNMGIDLTENTTKLAAVEYGIADLGQELTQSQKVMTRYKLVMSQMGAATGFMGDSLKTPAMQAQILKGNVEELKNELSLGLLPVVYDMIRSLNRLIAPLIIVARAFRQASQAVFGVYESKGVSQVEEEINKVNKSLEKVANTAKGLAGFDEMMTIGESGGGAFEQDTESTASNSPTIDASEAVKKLQGHFETILTFLDNNRWIYDFIKGLGAALGGVFALGIGIAIVNLLKLKEAFSVVWAVIRLVDEVIFKLVWGALKILIGAIRLVDKVIFKLVWGALKILIGAIGLVPLAVIGVTIALYTFKDTIRDVLVIIKDYFAENFGWIGDFISHIFDFIISVFDGWVLTVDNAIENVKGIFRGLVQFITGLMEGDFEKAFEGVKGIFKNAFKLAIEIGILGPLRLVRSTVNKIIDGLNLIKNKIPGVSKLSDIPSIPLMDIPSILPINPFGGGSSADRFADGGIITSQQQIIVGEQGRAEAIFPLENTRFIQSFADMVAGRIGTPAPSGNNGDMNLTIQLGTRRIVDEVVREIDRRSVMTGGSVIKV